MHGVALYFNANFNGKANHIFKQGPGDMLVRFCHNIFLLPRPLSVRRGNKVEVKMRMIANKELSYDVYMSSKLVNIELATEELKYDIDEPYIKQKK